MPDTTALSGSSSPSAAPSANSRGGRRFGAVWALIGVTLVVLAWAEFFLWNQVTLLGWLIVAAAAGVAALAATRSDTSVLRRVALPLAALVIAAKLLWFVSTWYPAWIVGLTGAILLGLISAVIGWNARPRGVTGAQRALRVGGGVLAGLAGVVAVVVSAAVVLTAITPVPATTAVQSMSGSGNSFDPEAPTAHTVLSDGTGLTNDLQYGTTYPNSYLDVYIADDDPQVSRPTLIYVHGGGWIMGSKSTGDPNAGAASLALGNAPVIQAGYNMVSIGYALAPQYTYPTPIYQLDEAVTFLKQHASEYGLDMSRVVLGGGSAGGQIAGQYANLQTNPAYAAQMGLTPNLTGGALKAVLLDSAALDMRRGATTQAPNAINDWSFGEAGKAYLDIADFPATTSSPDVDQANVITHTTAAFPPTFIADGNTGTFPDQARDLATALTALGVTNQLDLVPDSVATLGHGYMGTSDSVYVQQYNQRKVAWLQTVLG